MDTGDIATWVSALIAFGSAAQAIRASRAADVHQKQAFDAQQKASEAQLLASKAQQETVAALLKQNQLRERQWAESYFTDVRSWANDACQAIAEALHFARHPYLVKDAANRIRIESKLSYLLDTGRWYFPNHWSDDYGKAKEPAYRGLRQPILDHLFKAYNATRAMDNPECCAKSLKDLIQAQRSFVSEVQNVLDPRRREEEVKRVLTEFETAETLRAQNV